MLFTCRDDAGRSPSSQRKNVAALLSSAAVDAIAVAADPKWPSQDCENIMQNSRSTLLEGNLGSSSDEKERSAATTVGIVIGVFLACWLPFFIWMPLTSLTDMHTPPALYSVILWIGYGNSVVNPFVYTFCSREFRQELGKDWAAFQRSRNR